MKERLTQALEVSDRFVRWGGSGLAWIAGLRYFWRNAQNPSVWWRIHYAHSELIFGSALVLWLCFGGILTGLVFFALADLIGAVVRRDR